MKTRGNRLASEINLFSTPLSHPLKGGVNGKVEKNEGGSGKKGT